MTGHNVGRPWSFLPSYHRFARPVVTLVALVVAAAYLCWHAAAMLALAKQVSLVPTLTTIITIYLQWYLVALRDQLLLRTFPARPASLQTLALINAKQLILNVIPLYLGTMLKAQHYRQQLELPYAQCATLFTLQSVIALAISSVCGAIGALWIGQSGWLGLFVLLSFGLALFALLTLHFLPSDPTQPIWACQNRSFHQRPLRFRLQVFLHASTLTLGGQLLHCWRLSTLFGAIGMAHSWADIVLYAGVSQLSLWLVITPSGMGTKELLFGLVATTSGQSASLGVFTAVTERILAIGCALILIGSDQLSRTGNHPPSSATGTGKRAKPT